MYVSSTAHLRAILSGMKESYSVKLNSHHGSQDTVKDTANDLD